VGRLKDFSGFFMIQNYTWVINVGHLRTRMMGLGQGLDQLSSDWWLDFGDLCVFSDY
jgi:hypothetical protein